MKRAVLEKKNCEYDSDYWSQIRALYKGGKLFDSMLRKFLPQHPDEPVSVYAQRTREAHYENHVGPIIDFFVSWLFSQSFNVKAVKPGSQEAVEVDDFYKEFHEDVGDERSFPAFVKERTCEALQMKKSFVLVEMPQSPYDPNQPLSRLDYKEAGLGRARLKAIDRESVHDWSRDAVSGELNWITIYSRCEERPDPRSDKVFVVEQWRIYDRQTVELYEDRYEKGKAPHKDVTSKGVFLHGCKRVPIVELCLSESLWVGNRTFGPQLEHFRLNAGLSWLIRRCCYAMPVLKVADDENQPPTMGTGYYIQIGPDDDFLWTAPPQSPFDVIQKNIDAKREEIYRINHQMAQALDNNAETVGRSADSKEIDAAATRIILGAIGSEVLEFIEELYETIGEARDEKDFVWTVDGFSGYDTATASSLLGNAQLANQVGIPSQTFRAEICKKAARALLPDADQRTREKISKEIDSFKFTVGDPMKIELEPPKPVNGGPAK